MPHCIVEYAKTLEHHLPVDRLVEAVHQSVVDSQLFKLEHIKTRAVGYEHYHMGDGNSVFVHVTLKIMPGRSQEQKASLAESVTHSLSRLIDQPVVLTTEVLELSMQSYSKIIRH